MYLRQIGDTKVSATRPGGMPTSIEGRPGQSCSIAKTRATMRAPCYMTRE
jgi:hypothetical protein